MKTLDLIDSEIRPHDGERVLYYFEPFEKFYIGTYDSNYDSVSGSSGYTSWIPEVKLWSHLPENITL